MDSDARSIISPEKNAMGGKYKELCPLLMWNTVAPALLGWFVTRQGHIPESVLSRYMLAAQALL